MYLYASPVCLMLSAKPTSDPLSLNPSQCPLLEILDVSQNSRAQIEDPKWLHSAQGVRRNASSSTNNAKDAA